MKISYRSVVLRKQIKNHWARDDPAFVVLLIYFMSLSSLAYAITFSSSSTMSILYFVRMVFYSVFVEFLFVGCAIATLGWYLTNKYMKVRPLLSVEQRVEWLFAFDIHCNGFFPLFLILYVVQFFLSPLLLKPDFVACLIANTIYAFAICYYIYITFLGYSALPFLQNTVRFLHVIPIILILYLVSLLLNFNMTGFVMEMYFGT